MKTIRIIPRLDIKGPNVVKGIHLEGLRVLGEPSEFARYYYENGADELMFMDVVASLYERNSLHKIISETAKSIFIPLTVGGGIRTLEDIKDVLRAGADKVCINTAGIKNPELIKKAAQRFGASTIVVAIEAIKESSNNYLAYTDNGREFTGINVVNWAKQVEELGAGEIVLTSVDKEGTGEGFDLDLVKLIAKSVSIPVIAHGGAGKKEDIESVIRDSSADAVAISSILHYEYIANNVTKSNSVIEGNIEFLKNKRSFNHLSVTTLQEIKSHLDSNGITCRI
jgi:cyclase